MKQLQKLKCSFKCQVYSKDPEETYFTVDNLKVFINEKKCIVAGKAYFINYWKEMKVKTII